jgi:hypothetical protein
MLDSHETAELALEAPIFGVCGKLWMRQAVDQCRVRRGVQSMHGASAETVFSTGAISASLIQRTPIGRVVPDLSAGYSLKAVVPFGSGRESSLILMSWYLKTRRLCDDSIVYLPR